MLGRLKAGFVALMLALVMLSSAFTAFAYTEHTITVDVEDFYGNNIAEISGAGLMVSLTGSNVRGMSEADTWYPTLTDKEADFTVEHGTYTVTAQATGYTTQTINIAVDDLVDPDGFIRVRLLMPSDGSGTPPSNNDTPDQNDTQPTVGNFRIRSIKVNPDDKVGPGDQIEIEVKVDNDAGYDAEDVEVTVRIDDIDDGDYLEEDSDDFDLDDDDDKIVKLKFEIPMDVDEGNYDIEVRVDWDNKETGDSYYVEDNTEELEVEKEDHKIAMTSIVLSKTSADPGEPVELAVEMVNLGNNDETVKFTVESEDLNIDEESAQFELLEGEETTQYGLFLVPENIKSGNYYIYVTTKYNEGKGTAFESVILTVTGQSTGYSGGSTYSGSTSGVSLSPISSVSPMTGGSYQPSVTPGAQMSDVNVGLIVSIVALVAVLFLVGKEVLPLVQKRQKR